MGFKVPFTFSELEVLKERSKPFIKFVRRKRTKEKGLDVYLENAPVKISGNQYLSICFRSLTINFAFMAVLFLGGVWYFQNSYIFLSVEALVIGFIFINQLTYPWRFATAREKVIDRNLISVLQDMIVQLNSGVPIFDILVNISRSDYGAASEEFAKIVVGINSGVSQVEALERSGKVNTSLYFRRILWQISNGMRAGSDMTMVIKDGIRALGSEQEIQIQGYGSKLNPLIMFYMLIAVILPSLGITFLIIISSILNVSGIVLKVIFFGLFGVVVLVQVLFLGLIKSRRPSLL